MYDNHQRWLLIAVLAVAGISTAVADTMRCGGYLVDTGDSQSRVQQLCGDPQHAWQDGFIEETVRRNDGYYPANPVPGSPYPGQPRYETETRRLIPVYKWEYSFGPGTFLRTLTFHGETLVGIADGPRQ
ncbi:MAG: DUF2845 domain-containing protein [Candidatus Contendobacter sp.]|jgi:hypothetical protein|nr:DUF2845 domain-containing protein [Candidatus Contendobacter sp.]